MKFLILHGSFGSPEGNWFPRLKEKLELLNQDVLVPQMPVDVWDEVSKKGKDVPTGNQNLENWLRHFEKEVLPWAKDEKIVIVAHSLGPLFALHAMSTWDLKVDCAIFVSPFLEIPRIEEFWQIDVANTTFYNRNFDFEKLNKMIPLSFVLYSEDDPYVPREKALEIATKLHSNLIPVLGGEHLSSEFNHNEFPLVLELCKSRIHLTLYQKYLDYLSEYHPTDLVKNGEERAMFLPSSELAKEGTFHFRNLSIGGFCTIPVKNIDYWNDVQSEYMKEARKAASHVSITRVYIFENPQDMQNSKVHNAMVLDAKSGMHVYSCLVTDLNIPEEKLDFGIWDESYVCTVLYDESNVRFSLDSGHDRLKEAHVHKDMILEKSIKFDEKND